MISIRTNVDSLNAQQNLNINSKFQSKTVQQLTSGYRINSSGDDAAGLAIANGLRSNITELNQGVSNANDGLGQLQIVDGGLSNISTILDRMKTLATQSASGTFTGDRNTLNQEYSQLISEITRQASNINLNSGGSLNQNLSVYIGGANTTNSAGISVDLSGAKNSVDASSLGLASTNVLGGTFTTLSGNTTSPSNLNNASSTFLTSSASQAFTVNYVDTNGNTATKTLTVNGTASGISGAQVLNSLNTQLSGTGIQAGTDSNGGLQFTGAVAFNVQVGTVGGGSSSIVNAGTSTSAVNINANNYNANSGQAFVAVTSTHTDTVTFNLGSGSSVAVTLDATTGASAATAIAAINAKTAAFGIYAQADPATSGHIIFQSAQKFTISDSVSVAAAAGEGVLGTTSTVAAQTVTPTAPALTANNSYNAQAAVTAIDAAVKALGLVQGVVGAGENKLQYAVSLAQSQISSFSSAESQIRDADVAAAAANLTKSQVLQQTSIAAMAQANQEPQAVLKLLQG